MSENVELTYRVKGMTCGHCEASVKQEVTGVAGVERVDVNLKMKLVTVAGSALDDAAIRAAIDEAGYDAEAA